MWVCETSSNAMHHLHSILSHRWIQIILSLLSGRAVHQVVHRGVLRGPRPHSRLFHCQHVTRTRGKWATKYTPWLLRPSRLGIRHTAVNVCSCIIYFIRNQLSRGRIARGIFPFRNPAHRFHLQCTVQRHGAGGGCRCPCCSRSSLVVGGSGRRGGPRRDGGGGGGGWQVGVGSVGLWEQIRVPLWGGGKVWPESIRQCTGWWVKLQCIFTRFFCVLKIWHVAFSQQFSH